MSTCTLDSDNCQGYIPERMYEDIPDLPNPFVPAVTTQSCNKKKCQTNKIYKIENKSHKDEIYIVICFLLFVLAATMMYK